MFNHLKAVSPFGVTKHHGKYISGPDITRIVFLLDVARGALTVVLAVILIGFGVLISGCDQSESTTNITEPPPPGSAPSNDSTVVPRSGGICPSAGPCIADYTVTLIAAWEVQWTFLGANRSTTSAPTGQATWSTPGSYDWSSNVCDDAGTCAPKGETVTFISSGQVAAMAVQLGLIDPAYQGPLVVALDKGDPLAASGLLSEEGLAVLEAALLSLAGR